MLDEHDHRNIGRRLDLFHLQEEAPGMVFWHPRGYQVFRLVEEAVRRHMAGQGFREVRTPQILRQSIWETGQRELALDAAAAELARTCAPPI